MNLLPGAREVDPPAEAERMATRRQLTATWCGRHGSTPVEGCLHCDVARDINGRLDHEQDRCDPETCVHCAEQRGPGYE